MNLSTNIYRNPWISRAAIKGVSGYNTAKMFGVTTAGISEGIELIYPTRYFWRKSLIQILKELLS